MSTWTMAIGQEGKGISREFIKRYANAERKQQTKRRNTSSNPPSIPRLVGMQKHAQCMIHFSSSSTP